MSGNSASRAALERREIGCKKIDHERGGVYMVCGGGSRRKGECDTCVTHRRSDRTGSLVHLELAFILFSRAECLVNMMLQHITFQKQFDT